MTRDTRDGTDNARAARILAGLRERVSRLEKRDRHTEGAAHQLEVRSETVHPDDEVHLTVTDVGGVDGFGNDPFGSDFGSIDAEGDTETVIDERVIYNTTTHNFHAYVAEGFAFDMETPAPPTRIVLGDGTGDFEQSNTQLHNQFGYVDLIEGGLSGNGRTAVLNAQIDTGMYVGETLRELGVVTEDNRMLNHAPVSPQINKTDDLEISVEVRFRVTE